MNQDVAGANRREDISIGPVDRLVACAFADKEWRRYQRWILEIGAIEAGQFGKSLKGQSPRHHVEITFGSVELLDEPGAQILGHRLINQQLRNCAKCALRELTFHFVKQIRPVVVEIVKLNV